MTTGGSSTAFRRGDIVLVPFPAADLLTTKARPAVVVSSAAFAAGEGRLIVAAITSNVAAHRKATSYDLHQWAAAGLRKTVGDHVLAGQHHGANVVLHRVGTLGGRDMAEVGKRLRSALDL